MLSRVQLCSAACRIALTTSLKRNIGVSTACYQKTTATGSLDPIQKLFIDKVHEYVQKSKTAGGKLVDASPLTEKALKDELEKIARQYGATGADFQKFPTFNFPDVTLEPVGVQAEVKQVSEVAQETGEKDEEDDKPFYEL